MTNKLHNRSRGYNIILGLKIQNQPIKKSLFYSILSLSSLEKLFAKIRKRNILIKIKNRKFYFDNWGKQY